MSSSWADRERLSFADGDETGNQVWRSEARKLDPFLYDRQIPEETMGREEKESSESTAQLSAGQGL
jgi:hypothetical protein